MFHQLRLDGIDRAGTRSGEGEWQDLERKQEPRKGEETVRKVVARPQGP